MNRIKEAVGLKNDTVQEVHDTEFIGRQPIVNHKHEIIGYELLFRSHAEARTAVFVDDLKASARVLVNTVSHMDSQWLLGDKLAFINVNEEILDSDFLHLLVPKRTVLELLETATPSPELIIKLKALRAQGFKIALDDYVHTPENATLLQCADIIKLDVMALGLEKCKSMVSQIPSTLQLIGEKIESLAEFDACKELGFSLFQGYYFARPETLSAKVIHPSLASLIYLLNLLGRDAEITKLENGFKHDPALSFKLMRYINSSWFGFPQQIESIGHAISLLGNKQVYRFLALLLINISEKETAPALVKTVTTRGRLAELLGANRFDQQGRDNLFIVGVFSLLDVMLDMPMEQVLKNVLLPDAINEALLECKGMYAPFLELAVACEGDDLHRIKELAEKLDLTPEVVNDSHFAALAWAESLT